MENLFFKEILSHALLNKMATALPFLRKEHLKEEDLEDIMRTLQKEGFLRAIRLSKQDQEALKIITIDAFETATDKLKERFGKAVEQVFQKI